MPRDIFSLVTPERPDMLSNDLVVLLNDDALGTGMNFNRVPARLRVDQVFVIVEANQQRPRN
jgi:hypothetical protein